MPDGRRFGVEVEFNSLTVEEAQNLFDYYNIPWADIEDDYGVGPDGNWRVIHEPTVRQGAELNTPILDSHDPRSFDVICNVMSMIRNDTRATLDANAGLHVHLEVTDLSACSMFTIFTLIDHYYQGWQDLVGQNRARYTLGQSNQQFFDSIQDTLIARRHPGFEALPSYGSHNRAASASGMGWAEQFGIRTNCFLRQGTFEFRQHHSTLSGPRICNWVRFLVDFVNFCRDNPLIEPDDDGQIEPLVNIVADSQTRQNLLEYPQPRYAHEQ